MAEIPTEEQYLKVIPPIDLKFNVRAYINPVGTRLVVETESDVAFMDVASARLLRDWLNEALP